MSLFGKITHAVSHAVSSVAHTVEHAASNVVHTAEHAAVSTVHTVTHAAVSFVTHPLSTFSHVGGQLLHTVSHVSHSFGGFLSSVGHVAGSAIHTVEHAGSSVVHNALNGVHHIVDLGLHEGGAIGKALGHAAVNIGHTVGHDAASAFHTVTHAAGHLGSELVHTVGGVEHAIGHGFSAIGNGFVHTVGDVAHTFGHVAGDVVHTVSHVGGDIVHGFGDLAHGHVGSAFGDFTHIGKDVVNGAAHVVSDAAKGAEHVAADVGHAAAGVGHAFVEGGSALVSGALQMGGTVAGAAGELAKDYEHAMGSIVTNAVDSVGAIATHEVAAIYGAAGIVASTIGTPVGDFYANIAKHYGDAAIATLTHVNTAIDDAVNKSTKAGGDIMNSLGHGADHLGHDSGKVVSDIAHGDFSAAAHDLGTFGHDAFEAGKQFAGAEKEGVEALASIATAINTTLNGLNEAMARAGGGFVSAVGETIGGHAGHLVADAGDYLGKSTAMTSEVIQGDYEGAAKEGAKDLGGLAGGWAGDQVKHLADSLAHKFGGIIGDGLTAAGGAAADAIKDAGKDLGGAAAGKGLDAIKGGDDHSNNDNSGHANTADNAHPAADAGHDQSIFDKGMQYVQDTKDQLVHKVTDIYNKAINDPQALLNQGADMLKDHLVKGPGDAVGKVFAANVASHGNADTHGTDGATIGTSHAALTATNTFGGDSVESLLNHHADTGILGTAHDAHGISFSDLPAHLVENAHADANASSGAHNAMPDAISTVTHQSVSVLDHIAAHFELPGILHNDFVHVH